jgi:ribonuclease HIII
LNEIPPDLRSLLDRGGVEIAGSRAIDHGTQYDLARDDETAKLNVYRTGKISAGGRPSGLRELLEGWRTSHTSVGGTRASTARYFGPLVVAGVRITHAETARKLQEIGVRDSKEISAPGISRISGRILEAVGRNNVHVISLPPPEYESRRAAAGNVNGLLSELDATIMGKLVDEVEVVVVDEFARSVRSYLEPFVPDGVRLEVRTRAEDDAAVAAASIVARARQLEEIERLSERVGFGLPLGATHVVEAGRRVVGALGVDALAEVTKIHFATTRRVLKTAEQSDGGDL